MQRTKRTRDGRATGGDERLRELFRQAYGPLDAPDDIYERIADMTKHTDRKALSGWAHRVPARAAIAVAVSTVAVASIAVAAANTDFFTSAFGARGQEDVTVHEVQVDGKDSTVTLPSRTWVDVDVGEAERLVGAYVEEVGQTAEVAGYTLAVDACLVDENGFGVATYRVANPDGVAVEEAGYGEFFWPPDAAVSGVTLWGGGERYEDQAYDHRSVKDNEGTTATELAAVMYFGPFFADGYTSEEYDGSGRDYSGSLGEELAAAGEGGLVWSLTEQGGGEEEGGFVSFTPTKAVPATAFASKDGVTASISPLGVLVARSPNADPIVLDASWERVVVRFADDGEYVVYDNGEGGVSNLTASFIYEDEDGGGLGILFNRLVDTDAVEAIDLTDRTGATFTLVRG